MLWLFIVYSFVSLLAFGFWACLFGGIACFGVLLIMDKRMVEMHNSMLEELQALDRQNLQLQKELKEKNEVFLVGKSGDNKSSFLNIKEVSSIEQMHADGDADHCYRVIMKNKTVHVFTSVNCNNYNLDEFRVH